MRQAIKTIGAAMGATMRMAAVCAALPLFGDTVQTAPLGELDLDANPVVVTNVDLSGFATKTNTVVTPGAMVVAGPASYRNYFTNHYPVVYANDATNIAYATTGIWWNDNDIDGAFEEIFEAIEAQQEATRAALSRAEAEAGFTEWEWDDWLEAPQPTYIGSNKWQVVIPDMGGTIEADGAETATSLSFSGGIATATRTRLPTMAALDAAATTNAAQTALLADISSDLSTVGSQVSAIGSYLNAEDARFVSTNYDSAVRIPEAYVEVRLRDAETGSNTWVTIWQEMRRWGSFVGSAFDWQTWGGFHAWATNVTTELSMKADRAWGAYDSETGGWSPDGYTQISSSNIMIAAGMAYQRTVTSAGAVWVLQCNQGTAHIGGDTNGFFRITDGEGNVQFEIVKGDRMELGCDASGISVAGPNHVMTIPYSVDSAEHPTIQCCNDLLTQLWKSEEDPDCLCTVSWSGTSGAYVATVTPKTAQTKMFVKATYMAGAETYIRNTAPISVDGGIKCTDGVHKVRPVYNNGTITWEVVQ